MWRAEGLDGLLRLAAIEHMDADGVGRTAATSEEVPIELEQVLPLLTSTTNSDQRLARGLIGVWAWQSKDSLSSDVLPIVSTMSSDEMISSYLCCLPVGSEVW